MGQAGAKLEDRYHVQKVKLGQGAFGVVWRAVDRATQEFVAIKQLDKAALPRCGVCRADVEREIDIMMACRHVNVLGLHATFEDATSVSLALEYCDAGDFGDKLSERGQSLVEEDAVRWMRDILSGVAALHRRGICHRDIKPDNFMVKGSKGDECLKLADFGLACAMPRRELLTQKVGTPAFVAPEVHLLPSGMGYGLACDVWAAGVILCMLLHRGKHPFLDRSGYLAMGALMSGKSAHGGLLGLVQRHRSGLSESAWRLCKSMLQVSQDARTSAAEALRGEWFVALGAHASPALSPASSPPASVDTDASPFRDGGAGCSSTSTASSAGALGDVSWRLQRLQGVARAYAKQGAVRTAAGTLSGGFFVLQF